MASPNLHYERDRGSRRHNKVPGCGRLGEARVLADHQRPQLRVRCAGQSWPASLRRFCCGSDSRHCNPSLCAERLKRTAIFQPRRRHREVASVIYLGGRRRPSSHLLDLTRLRSW